MQNDKLSSDLPRDITEDVHNSVIGAQLAAKSINVVVDSDEALESASEDLIQIKTYQKEVTALKKSVTDPLNARKNAVIQWFKPAENFLISAESTLKRVIGDYQDKVAEEARKAAEAEAKRLEKLAERKADRAKKKGDTERAEEILDESRYMYEVVVSSAATATGDVKGISKRSTWTAEVIDKEAFVRAVVEGIIPLRFIQVDQAELNKLARALKNDLSYPGVKVHEKKSIAVRT